MLRKARKRRELLENVSYRSEFRGKDLSFGGIKENSRRKKDGYALLSWLGTWVSSPIFLLD